jgi:putative membrane protein
MERRIARSWMLTWTVSTMAALSLTTSLVQAQTSPARPQTEPPGSATGTPGDRQQASRKGVTGFVMEAAGGGVKEVEAGRIASTRASNAEVKAFAQKMVDDHGKANEELKSLASSKQITLPDDAAAKAKHEKALARLEKLDAAAFDKAYMDEMVKDHQKTVALFEREAKSGSDAELKAFAEKTLPTLREHLKMATDIRGKLGAKTSD